MVQLNLEIHLINYKRETIPDEDVKRMLYSCITGSARKEIVLCHPTGLAFKNYGTGDFFTEMLKRFSQEKYEEGQKQEYLDR